MDNPTPPEIDHTQILIFIRATHFYPIHPVKGVGLAKQAADNAELNPGTLRVEDEDGNVLWRLQ